MEIVAGPVFVGITLCGGLGYKAFKNTARITDNAIGTVSKESSKWLGTTSNELSAWRRFLAHESLAWRQLLLIVAILYSIVHALYIDFSYGYNLFMFVYDILVISLIFDSFFWVVLFSKFCLVCIYFFTPRNSEKVRALTCLSINIVSFINPLIYLISPILLVF